MSKLLTIGIGVDDYKLKKFKDALEKEGFTEYTVTPFSAGASFIKVSSVSAKRVWDIKKICEKLQIHFNQSN